MFLVELSALRDLDIGFSALVEDGECRAIQLRLLDSVFVDETAEDLMCLFLLTHNDGRARKSDTGAVGQSFFQVGMQLSSLRAVRLIDDDQDILMRIDYRHARISLVVLVVRLVIARIIVILVCLNSVARIFATLVFLDHSKYKVRTLWLEFGFKVLNPANSTGCLLSQLGRLAQLLLQFRAVSDKNDLEVAQLWDGAHLAH